jgi:hypothetical protein
LESEDQKKQEAKKKKQDSANTKIAESCHTWLDNGSAQKLLGVLSVKCLVFWGLLPTAYAKLFLNDP